MSGVRGGSRGTDPGVRQRASEGDPVALAQVLVSIPSVNPELERGGAGEGRIAGQTARWLADWGYDVSMPEPRPGRPNVIARRSRAGPGPTLLLNGHLDTVGVDGMTVAPFEGLLHEGRILGRGACDMKGGLAAILATAWRLAEESHGGELVVALTCDEEHASAGMAALVADEASAAVAIVCEPTGLALMPAHKGFVWIEAVFHGRAAHGSRPEVGVDAIRHAARFLVELDALESELGTGPAHALLGRGSVHAGTISGGTAASVYPERCSVVLERRTLPGEDPARALQELEATLARARRSEPALSAELRAGLARPGTEVATDHALVTGLAAAARKRGLPARIEGMTAWVDAAFLNEAGTPAVCFGPGSIAQAHSADEWIEADQIAACADVLTDFARAFLAGR